jgi:hypothetical protein
MVHRHGPLALALIARVACAAGGYLMLRVSHQFCLDGLSGSTAGQWGG